MTIIISTNFDNALWDKKHHKFIDSVNKNKRSEDVLFNHHKRHYIPDF